MADRESRFQMRQRGAGARNVDDFSFNIATASSDRATSPDDSSPGNALIGKQAIGGDDLAREQRFLMRRRGPGGRDVDFTLNLEVPAASSPTGRISVAGSTSSTGSIGRARVAATRTDGSPLVGSTLAPVVQTAVDSDGSVTKKRRVSLEEQDSDEDEAEFLDDEGSVQQPLQEDIQASVPASTSSSRTRSTESTKRRKKKKSVLRKPKRRKATNSESSVASSVIAEEEEGEFGQAVGNSERDKSIPMDKRDSRQSNRPLTVTSPSPEDTERASEEPEEERSNANIIRNQQSADSPDQPRLYGIFDRTNRPAAARPIPAVQRILNEHGVGNKENRPLNISSKPKATATVPKQPKSSKSRTKTTRKGKQPKSKASHGLQEQNNQVVITVHRVANISRLSFMTGEEDELITEQIPTIRQKKSPNGIDVLAQICHEVIGKRITALSTDPRHEQPNQKAALKRQIDTITRFSEELACRLLIMTTALDHNISLAHNLREATRLKSQHRATLLDLRQQRHAIELQQDAIRSANETATTQAAERFELNSLLGDIQLAVQRGKDGSEVDIDVDVDDDEEPRESLTMRLQRVGEVVGTAAKKGLLARVRMVNDLLEGLV